MLKSQRSGFKVSPIWRIESTSLPSQPTKKHLVWASRLHQPHLRYQRLCKQQQMSRWYSCVGLKQKDDTYSFWQWKQEKYNWTEPLGINGAFVLVWSLGRTTAQSVTWSYDHTKHNKEKHYRTTTGVWAHVSFWQALKKKNAHIYAAICCRKPVHVNWVNSSVGRPDDCDVDQQ